LKGRNILWLFAISFATAILFCRCDDPKDTGANVLPPEDLINLVYTDTSTVLLNTDREDSVITAGLSRSMFGNYIDPECGRIKATSYFQFRIPGSSLDFGDDVIFDSMVLQLDVTGVYGRYDSPQKIRVLEIDEDIPVSDTVTSNLTLATKGTELSNSRAIDFRSIPGFTDMRMRLSDELGERVLFAPDSVLASNDAFTEYFKGLSITTEDVDYFSREPGAVFYFNPGSALSKVYLYFQARDSGETEYTSFLQEFFLSTGPYYHSISRADYEDKLLGAVEADSTGIHEYEFVQSGALIKGRLNIPYLENFGKVGVNRAELILYAEDDFFGSFTGLANRFVPPGDLFLYETDSLGNEDYTAPVSIATYESSTQSYTFTITNYSQQLLNGARETRELIVWPANTGVALNRVVLGGNAHPSLKPVLKFTYTPLPE